MVLGANPFLFPRTRPIVSPEIIKEVIEASVKVTELTGEFPATIIRNKRGEATGISFSKPGNYSIAYGPDGMKVYESGKLIGLLDTSTTTPISTGDYSAPLRIQRKGVPVYRSLRSSKTYAGGKAK